MSFKETMRHSHKPRSGIALGGIGAGCFEIRKDGCFYNWSIFNNYPFATGPALKWPQDNILFFIVRWQVKGDVPRMKLLQIEGDPQQTAAIESMPYIYPWMTGMERIDCEASFPFTRLRFSDPDMPLVVELEASSSFIPHDVKHSALPAAIFRFKIVSTTNKPIDVNLIASLRSVVGYDTDEKTHITRILDLAGGKLVETSCDMDSRKSTCGSMALASLAADTTHYAGWESIHPYYEKILRLSRLPDIDDTAGRNITDKQTGVVRGMSRFFSSLASGGRLSRRSASLENTILVTWNFPNLYAAIHAKGDENRIEGHYYNNFFSDAAAVARYVAAELPGLTARTRQFHDDYFDSTAPKFVLDQVNSQLNTFFTSSWLTRAGDFGIEEGLLADIERGPLATIDVGMYGSVMTAALFPELDRAMLLAHRRLQDAESGAVSHGIGRNFASPDVGEARTGRLDLPSQYALMALRHYFWTGDVDYLRNIWPSVKAALEYVLKYRDANGDLLPDMEGIMCTYDNFPMHGVASFVAGQFIAAVAFASQAAKVIGDEESAARYADIRAKGGKVFEEKLWNGKYYRLYNDEGGKRGDKDESCLTDQIIGQWAMRWIGSESLLDPGRVRKALSSIMKMSYRDYGLINCRWPGDGYLHEIHKDIWVDQANTCWTGVELAFASLLIYEGLVEDGLKVVKNVDDRYRRAGLYFDQHEFGGHYYRPMSAWGIINAMLGLSVNDGIYRFGPRLPGKKQKLFFAAAEGTGHFACAGSGKNQTIALSVASGRMQIKKLIVELARGEAKVVQIRLDGAEMEAGKYSVNRRGELEVGFSEPLELTHGRRLTIRLG